MKVNQRNPAVKRILADVRELQNHATSAYTANPLEDNMFEWHFTIRGPTGTAFEGGVFHGRILLPAEYPFKPPNIVFMTPNGRFEVGTKICLSISAYHPEHWQPAWGVRTILEALISFLPTEGNGAIGALDWTSQERQRLARESVNFECPVCGKIVDTLPEPSSTEQNPEADKQAESENGGATAAPQFHLHYLDGAPAAEKTESASSSQREANFERKEELKQSDESHLHERGLPNQSEELQRPSQAAQAAAVAVDATAPLPHGEQHRTQETHQRPPATVTSGRDFVDDVLLALMVVIGLAILYLVARRLTRDPSDSFSSSDL